jgi:predicted Zn-dependent protease with MMP-like domain
MVSVSRERFEELVADALDTVPAELADILTNVVVLVEDDPPDGNPGLLGLYEGVPLTERGEAYSGVLPDVITIFRHPLMLRCASAEEIVDEVRITVVHELAHHFGIDDDRLHGLGYG